MSDVFEPELIQEDFIDAPMAESAEVSMAEHHNEPVTEHTEDAAPAKKGLLGSFFSMGIFNVMLLLSLVFILWATLNMLGVLRIYNDSFPFGGGAPWTPNL